MAGAAESCAGRRTLRGHAGEVTALAFVSGAGAGGDQVLVSAGVDRQLRMWHAHSGQQLRRAQLRAPVLDLLALSALPLGAGTGAGAQRPAGSSCNSSRVCLPLRLASSAASPELDVPLFVPGALGRAQEQLQLDSAFDRFAARHRPAAAASSDIPNDAEDYKEIASRLLSLVSNTTLHSNSCG